MIRRLIVLAMISSAAIAWFSLQTQAASASAGRSVVSTASPSVCEEEQVAGSAVHHAGLVIVFDSSRTESMCIEFTEDEISGVDLLRRSGMPLVLSGFGGVGTGVCRIDDVGCSDPGDCFCQCRGADCHYWAYYALDGSAWHYENRGASLRRLHDGDVDAWVWGSGHDEPGAARAPCPIAAAPTATAPLHPPPATSTPQPPTTASTGGRAAPATGVTPDAIDSPTRGGATPTASNATAQVRANATVDGGDGGSKPPGASQAEAADTSDGGVPIGLISFGVVATALVAGGGGIAIWRRRHG